MTTLNKVLDNDRKLKEAVGLVKSIRTAMIDNINTAEFRSGSIGEAAMSNESSESQQVLVGNSMEELISSLADKLSVEGHTFQPHQYQAGAVGAIFANNPLKALNSKLDNPFQGRSINQSGGGVTKNVTLAVESYRDQDLDEVQTSTAAFNILASAQDAFSAAFYSPVIVSPTSIGISATAHIYNFHADYDRAVTGEAANTQTRDLIRAFVNSDILHNEHILAIPVWRPAGPNGSEDKFVDTADVPTFTRNKGDGVVIVTGALKTNIDIEWIGLSQTNQSLNRGPSGYTTILSNAITLESLYFKNATEVIRLNVRNAMGSSFFGSNTGSSTSMTLDMESDSIFINAGMMNVAGVPVTSIPNAALHNLRLHVTARGRSKIDSGITNVTGGNLVLVGIERVDGLPVVAGDQAAIVTALATFESVGFTLHAPLENTDLRYLGQMVETKNWTNFYTVPYHSPVTSYKSVFESEEEINKLVATLISITQMKATHDAVDCIFRTADTLRDYKSIPDVNGAFPKTNAIGSQYLIPKYIGLNIKMSELLDSVTSANRSDDARAALLSIVRQVILDLLVGSEYRSSATLLTNDKNFKPHAVIGTDEVLANYLAGEFVTKTPNEGSSVNGNKIYDFGTFTAEIVSTVSDKMYGKIAVGFSYKGRKSGELCPLTFGVFAYSSELVTTVARSVNGQTSRVPHVQPRFTHINTNPVLGLITVSELDLIPKKQTIFTKVTP